MEFPRKISGTECGELFRTLYQQYPSLKKRNHLAKYCLTVLKISEPEAIAKKVLKWMRKDNATSTGGFKVALRKVKECLPKVLKEIKEENGSV